MEALHDPFRHEGNPVTHALVAAMLVVSVPTMFWGRLNHVFGGIGEMRYPWQVFSSAFEHGWPGFPLLLHLVLNLALMFTAAVMAERLLGSARFLALSLLAICCYWLTRQILFPLQANGSSVFIWSYAPILLAAVLQTRRAGGPFGEAYRRATGLLFVMWVVVTVALSVFLALGGVDPVSAVLYGNAFHLSGTVAGFLGVALWRGHVLNRLRKGAFPQSGWDRTAAKAGFAIPLLFGILLVGAAIGWI